VAKFVTFSAFYKLRSCLHRVHGCPSLSPSSRSEQVTSILISVDPYFVIRLPFIYRIKATFTSFENFSYNDICKSFVTQPSSHVANIYIHNTSHSFHLPTLKCAVAQWLRRGASNRKVAGSIPDGVIGIFN